MDTDLTQTKRFDQVLLRHELDVVRLRPHWWRPKVRILVVADRSGSFDETESFGLGMVIAELRNDPRCGRRPPASASTPGWMSGAL